MRIILKWFFYGYLLIFGYVKGTIDVNISEIQYLAAHLKPRECRLLTAALHFNNYELPENLDAAEKELPNDVGCGELLLHWNSAESEGRGRTHEIIGRRLRQLGRADLADWLGKTTFSELSKDLLEAIEEPSTEISRIDTGPPHDVITELSSPSGETTAKAVTANRGNSIDDEDWDQSKSVDIIFFVVFALITLLSLSCIVFVIILITCQMMRWIRSKNYDNKAHTSDAATVYKYYGDDYDTMECLISDD